MRAIPTIRRQLDEHIHHLLQHRFLLFHYIPQPLDFQQQDLNSAVSSTPRIPATLTLTC